MPSRIVTAEYHNVRNKEFLLDEEAIKHELRLALEEAGATLYSEVNSYNFGLGVTALAIIGESHGAFHTYSEIAYARLTFDSYSHMKPERAVSHFEAVLQPAEKPIVQGIELTLPEKL